MRSEVLTLETIAQASPKAAADFQEKLTAAVLDCKQCPEQKKARVVTLKLSIEWATFQADDAALSRPDAVAAIAETIAGNPSETSRVFVAAVVSQSKDRPWNYFRSLILSGNYLTTNATKQQLRTAETMLRFTNGTDAAEIVPTTGEEAWAKVLSAIARWDYMHQLEQIRAELGPQIHATVRAIGGFAKIAQTDKSFQHTNRRAFLDAWTAQQTVSTAMR